MSRLDIRLRASEIAAVCDEVAALVGLPVQKVVQPEPWTVLVSLRGSWVLLSADPAIGRLCLVDKPAGTGEAAPAFCMLLRKELYGRRLERVVAVPGERACELNFGDRAVRLFLFGKAAQLVLVDTTAERVLGAVGPAREPWLVLPPPREPGPPSRFTATGVTVSQQIAAFAEDALKTTAEAQRVVEQRRQADRLRRREQALLADLARVDATADARRDADLLLAHAFEIPKGARETTLPDDFSDGRPIVIRLDPARTIQENAAHLYHAHKRLQRARAGIEERLAATRRELAVVESGHITLPASPSGRTSKRGGPVARPPYHRFTSANGTPILVGRGAAKNDELTFHVARGADLWLHTRDVPGAHVVVPLGGREVDEATLLDAATLAAWHSPARDETQVDVGYTLRKHVRKPPRAAPGLVTTAGLKTIRVRMEPERLKRLLATADSTPRNDKGG
jgi:predicted ribosome quality control (RQC) complex YloA/Tae2 family protein